MIDGEASCPRCGSTAVRKDGLDRKGTRAYRCRGRRRCCTARSTPPFSGYRFPSAIIALAVRWYRPYRRSDADVAELVAERGVRADPSSVDAWVQEFAPRYEDTARSFRRHIGACWSVDETHARP